jgi:ADP-L-glycero-D-manno-heptose 6-epimerase
MNEIILVTGGAGFIGRNLVAELNRRGEERIFIVDELGCTDKWKNLVGLRYEEYWDKQEFRRRILENKLDGVRAILHMGACSATTETDAAYLADNNYRTTRELCEWCLTHGARFVYASSAATYGDGSRGYSDDDAVTPSLVPLNMYGYSKHMFDLWAINKGIFNQIAGLKYFNVYGPHEDHKGDMRSVVHKSYEQIRDTGEVKLFKSYKPDYADGEQVRDFVYVQDAVAMTLYAMEHQEFSGLFNCGTGQARTWKDLANAVFAAMGRDPVIQFVDMPEMLQGKYQYFTQAKMDKARKAGFVHPFQSLEDGIKDYVQSYLQMVQPCR